MAAVPSFPPEIVGLILESYRSDRSQDDLTFQWATLRQVCHHWKATMEKMFLTEHVPKTKLHCRMKVKRYQAYYEPDVELEYVGLDPKYPGRAIFAVPQSPHMPDYMNAFFNAMKDSVAPGRTTNAVKARSGEPRFYENAGSIFLTQIRGCLGDCPLPNVAMDRKKREMSLEWKDLYTCFFGEKARINALTEGTCINTIGLAPSPPASQPLITRFQFRVANLKPSLQALGRSDLEDLERYSTAEEAAHELEQRQLCPIKWWRRDVNQTRRHRGMSLGDYQARHQADQYLSLDEEGALKIHEMKDRQEATLARGRNIFWKLTVGLKTSGFGSGADRLKACDCCREMGLKCSPETAATCDTCLANDLRCEGALADLNRHSGSPSIGSYYMQNVVPRVQPISPITPGNHALQDYQMQLMLIEQQKRRQQVMGCRVSDQAPQPPPRYPAYHGGNYHPLQVHQMQLMLLERQNKKRLLMARQEQDATTQNGSDAASSSAGPSQAPMSAPQGVNHALQDYQMQAVLLQQQNDRRLIRMAHQNSNIGPSHVPSPSSAMQGFPAIPAQPTGGDHTQYAPSDRQMQQSTTAYGSSGT